MPGDAVARFAAYAPRIAALPERTRYGKDALLVPDFLLAREGRLAIYYAPFDYTNAQARVILVGISPGFRQMEIALRESRALLLAGALPDAQIVARVKYVASFAGPIRKNLLAMLDGIGLPAALGIASSAALYAERADLLHTSAVVHHPVFLAGDDWTGHTPPVRSSPLLRRYLWEGLLPELRAVPGAVVVPLGRCAEDALAALSAAGALDPARCLAGLPHPSGANGHRVAQFARTREALAERVAAWFGGAG